MYDKMQTHDKKMATDLVDALLAQGCRISVHDGETYACSRSTNRAEILDCAGNTDMDVVHVRNAEDARVGYFVLVYGNDPGETINDYTANDFCQSIVDQVEALNPMLGE